MEAFCFKCRGKHPLLDPKPIFFANGSPATQGTCANCGYDKVYKMGRTPAHEGLTPPEPVKRERKPKSDGRTSRAKGKANASANGDSGAPDSPGLPLVIVESPAKARTIGKFLGRKYTVRASIGHIRDLPKSRLGVDVDKDFEPTYIIPADKKATVKELKQYAKAASSIWLATDPDREGEAISWHLTHALQPEIAGKPIHRVEFHEITKDAIDHAFAHPRSIDDNAVNAQQARRILDRLVGYKLSPLLSDKLSRRGLSAGRVQSVALRLVVEREREIQAFTPVEYWSIEAELAKEEIGDRGLETSNPQSLISLSQPPAPSRETFIARLFKLRGQDPDLKNEADAQRVVGELEGASYRVVKVERKDRARRPAAPFTTSTMQQEASRKLGFNARRTMAVAQQLYEGIDIGEGTVGLITYMRTDSVNVAESAQREARQFIAERYGTEFMPEAAPKYTSRAKNAQEAHEAIRPTSVFRTPESLKDYLDRDQFRLYELIWKRFIASQMANAVFDATTVDIEATPQGATSAIQASPQIVDEAGDQTDTRALIPGYWFRATGSVTKFAGFLKVYEEGHDEGEKLDEEEEARGRRLPELFAGEPLDLIRLIPEQHFTQPPPRYTEASLVKALEEYGIGRPSTYAQIMTTIQSRDYVRKEGKQLVPTELGFAANDLLVANFPRYIDVGFTAHVEEELDDIETGAREWRPVLHEFYDPFKEAVAQAAERIPKKERTVQYTGEKCPDCEDGLLVYREGRFGRFIACSNFPKCKHTEPIAIPGVQCPKCGGKLVEKRARKGQRRVFYGCANYPACDFTTWNKPLAIQGPEGCEGLVVEIGKGKAKCLGNDLVFDIPESSSESVPALPAPSP
ncbi:MAG: type I DNA topoisomerase [Candidatus Brachytrichaceae bacterium NZ_4S206]|jgi:DNA topoisomerase-1